MRFLRFIALSTGMVVSAGLLSTPSEAAAASKQPSVISSLSAASGSTAGTVVFRWKSAGKRTDYFVLETAVSPFNKSKSSTLPASGRHAKKFTLSATTRSWTMSRKQSAAAGASVGSGNYLYYRLSAVNKVGKTTYTKTYPRLGVVMPKARAAGLVSADARTTMRVATFNLRTAQLDTGRRAWLARADKAAQDILSTGAAVVFLQEASPGRADGQNAAIGTVGRQTTTLVDRLKKTSGSTYDYAMVRTTSYVAFDRPSGTQGTRILYDTRRVKLLSSCPEYTGKSSYNSSCSFALPILSGDSESKRRRGAYALFQNRSTGQRFWAISAHLDERRSTKKSTAAAYDRLRGAQAKAVAALARSVNTASYPVVLGADLNTWQHDPSGYAGHDALVAAGFSDTRAAASRSNVAYSTVNEFQTRVPVNGNGVGAHLDVIMVQGGRGDATRWVNKLTNPDANRSSDHNLVYADVTI